MSLRQLSIRRSGVRTALFLGGDRELVMMSGLLSGILVVATQDILAMIVGVALWFVSLKLLRLMAKADPLMRQVYLRHRRYQDFYPARSTPFRENTRGYPSWS